MGAFGDRTLFDHGKRVAMWMLSGLTILLGYGLAKLEPFATAQLLPLTALDRAVPLIPWTVWIYGSGTLVCLLAWLSVPDRLAARRLYFSLTLSAMLCWVFFLLWPTTYPRELWPLPTGSSSTLLEFRSLRLSDSPSNCFPSQHVALAWALALCWSDWTAIRWFKPLPVLWAALVSLTTLTTKQHYLVDIPGGMLIGVGSWWLIRGQIAPRVRSAGLSLSRARDRAVAEGLLAKVRAHQWALSDVPWPVGPLPALPPEMARLLNQTVYVEEIAGLNFKLLQGSTTDPILVELYGLFAEEERRHADGLRQVLELHGHEVELPGMGTALVLDQFDTLDPGDLADALLVAVSTPVFETFLDAGTIPFLRTHPALSGPAFDALVAKIDADEGAHLALNWLVTREAGREHGGLGGLKLLLNPNIYRGMIAVPFMSLETYTLAHALGYDLRGLYPAFSRLWRLHRKYPELQWFGLWGLYRMFVLAGAVATFVASGLATLGILVIGLWTRLTRLTDHVAWWMFGEKLLERRGLQRGLERIESTTR